MKLQVKGEADKRSFAANSLRELANLVERGNMRIVRSHINKTDTGQLLIIALEFGPHVNVKVVNLGEGGDEAAYRALAKLPAPEDDGDAPVSPVTTVIDLS